MGVMIDEPGGDNAPRGVDGALGGGPGIFADPDDLAVLHRDICEKSSLARAVYDAPVCDQEIIRHAAFSSLPRSGRARGPRRGPAPRARSNSVRLNCCTRVLCVLRMPKQGFQEGDSPVLEAFLGSPGANFLVATWVERSHCPLLPSQKA